MYLTAFRGRAVPKTTPKAKCNLKQAIEKVTTQRIERSGPCLIRLSGESKTKGKSTNL